MTSAFASVTATLPFGETILDTVTFTEVDSEFTGFILDNATAGCTVEVREEQGNKYLSVSNGATAGNSGLGVTFAAQTGDFTAEFKVRPHAGNNTMSFENNKHNLQFKASNGVVTTYNGSSAHALSGDDAPKVVANSWNDIRVDFKKTDVWKHDLYINGTLAVTDYPLRDQNWASFGRINLRTYEANASIDYDDVTVYKVVSSPSVSSSIAHNAMVSPQEAEQIAITLSQDVDQATAQEYISFATSMGSLVDCSVAVAGGVITVVPNNALNPGDAYRIRLLPGLGLSNGLKLLSEYALQFSITDHYDGPIAALIDTLGFDDFNGYNLGDAALPGYTKYLPSAGHPGKLEIVRRGDYDNCIFMASGDEALNPAIGARKYFAPQADQFITEFDIYPLKGAACVYLGNDSQGVAISLYFDVNNSVVSAFDGANDKKNAPGFKVVSKWYKVKVHYTGNNKFDLYMDGKRIMDQWSVRQPAASYTFAYLSTGGAANIDVYYDNLKIYTSEKSGGFSCHFIDTHNVSPVADNILVEYGNALDLPSLAENAAYIISADNVVVPTHLAAAGARKAALIIDAPMEYGKSYRFAATPAITAGGYGLKESHILDFRVKDGGFFVTDVKATDGGGSVISSVAGKSEVNISYEVSNNTTESEKPLVFIYALYSGGRMTAIKYRPVVLDQGQSEAFVEAIAIPPGTDGVRVFFWDDFDNRTVVAEGLALN